MPDKHSKKSISALAAEKLIAAHDGTVALLYIYVVRTGCYNREKTASDLFLTLREVEDAEEKLRRMDLWPQQKRPQSEARTVLSSKAEYIPDAPEELPEYSTDDINIRSTEDPAFTSLIEQATLTLGRSLSSVDLRTLLGIYDKLGDAETVFVLLKHCGDISSGSEGQARKPTMRFIEKEAFKWLRNGIGDYRAAEEYAEHIRKLRTKTGRIKAILDIGPRKLVASESEYIRRWLELGFDEDAISMAYNSTVMNTGKLSWAYLNKILLKWDEADMHTGREIEKKFSKKNSSTERKSVSGKKPITDFGDGS